jgi:hypothetical protein
MCYQDGLCETGLALVESRVELRRPGDGVRTLDFGSGVDVMERDLRGSSVVKETPVEIEHSQETSKLTDGLGKGAGLDVCYSFRELGALGGDFVTQE